MNISKAFGIFFAFLHIVFVSSLFLYVHHSQDPWDGLLLIYVAIVDFPLSCLFLYFHDVLNNTGWVILTYLLGTSWWYLIGRLLGYTLSVLSRFIVSMDGK